MRALPIINKVFNLFSIISLIIGMGSSIPSYSSSSSWEDDLSESSKSEKITGNKRLRDSSSDSGEPDTKRRNFGEKEERESTSIEENLSIYSSKDYNSAEENSGSKESLKSLNVDSEDVFYIFNVGQGNSQLAVYSEGLKEPVGVLYDCGSSAGNVHPKIAKARSSQGYNIIISRKASEEENNNIDFGQEDLNTSLLPTSLDSFSKKSAHMSSRTSSGNISYDAARENLIDVPKFIKETIEDHHIKFLFVILSHADRDHINLIPSVIPEGVKSLFLLGGDFLQKSDNDNGKLKQDIQELFKFFAKRNNSEFSLPYFWNFSKYNGIRTGIKNYIFEQDESLLALSRESLHSMDSTPSPLYGSLFDLLNLMDEKEKKSITSYLAPLLEQENIKQKLDNIYIWGFNRLATDINDQSIIVSLKMPSLGKSFICTGDAREDIFVDIYRFISNQEKYKIDEENLHRARASLHSDNKENAVVLLLPHHGSLENLSLRMLDLFKPDVLAISAGAGMYPHPSNELIKKYKSEYRFNPETNIFKITTNIWKNYETVNDCYYLSFIEKQSKSDSKESIADKQASNTNRKSSDNNKKKLIIMKKIKKKEQGQKQLAQLLRGQRQRNGRGRRRRRRARLLRMRRAAHHEQG